MVNVSLFEPSGTLVAPSPYDRGVKLNLPSELEAHEPPEARGVGRDGIRMMVSFLRDNRVVHAQFKDLPHFLSPGDVLVINTSGTLNAAVKATRADGTLFELHLSTHLDGDNWTVELRRPVERGTAPFLDARVGEVFTLPGNASVVLQRLYKMSPGRIWVATMHTPRPVQEYLAAFGFPIRYGYVNDKWDLSYYQTVYVTEPGSAEMPSAGRPFTPELITQLVAGGVQIVPLILHTGVASTESREPPYDEFFRVTAYTAEVANSARAEHRRIIAVGTTVVRALESATDMSGVTWAQEGWTELVVSPKRGIRAVNGLLTGLHEPRSTHLDMLEALAGREHVQIAYEAALKERYLWHEFGDVHLILPS